MTWWKDAPLAEEPASSSWWKDAPLADEPVKTAPVALGNLDSLMQVQSSVPATAQPTSVVTDPSYRSVMQDTVAAPALTPTMRKSFDEPVVAPSMRAGTMPKANPMESLGSTVADAPLPVRALAKAATTGAEGIGGLVRATGDFTGMPKVSAFGAAGAGGAQAFEKGMGTNGPVEGFGPNSPVPYLADMAEGAGASAANMLLLGGAVGPKAALWAMGLQTAGQEYDQARQQGLEPGAALAGAAIKGGFEVAGEKLAGVDKVLHSLGTLLSKGASVEAKRSAGQAMLASGIKEVPGEVFTYLGQSATDILPGIGIKQDMTVSDFLDGLRDTVVQASMMGGAMGASGAVINRGTQPEKPLESAEQMARARGFLTQPTPRVEDQPTVPVVPVMAKPPAQSTGQVEVPNVAAAATFAENAPVQAQESAPLLPSPAPESLTQRASAAIKTEAPNVSMPVAADATIQPGAGVGSAVDPGGVGAGGLVDGGQGRPNTDRPAGDAGRSESAGVLRDGGGGEGAVDPRLASVVGKPINKDWASFSPESGTLGIPRAEMPQVKAEHRGAMVNFLNARGIAHERDTVAPASLKPTQAEFSPEKVLKAVGSTEGDRSILVSKDGHVLDGHHQWMAAMKAGEPVNIIRLDAPVKELLDAVHEFPSSEVAGGVKPADNAPAGPVVSERLQSAHIGGVQAGPATDSAKAESKQPPEPSGRTFTTAKGSTYTINADGTTTRDKAFRAEHGQAEQGIQPTSERTFYVTAADSEKLGEIQARGAGTRSVVTDGAQAGVKYEEGPSAGKIERRTAVPIQTAPAVGLVPVETWDGGRRVHFGNTITSMTEAPAKREAAAPAEPIAPIKTREDTAPESAQQDVKQQVIDLRKRASILKSLRTCLGG